MIYEPKFSIYEPIFAIKWVYRYFLEHLFYSYAKMHPLKSEMDTTHCRFEKNTLFQIIVCRFNQQIARPVPEHFVKFLPLQGTNMSPLKVAYP